MIETSPCRVAWGPKPLSTVNTNRVSPHLIRKHRGDTLIRILAMTLLCLSMLASTIRAERPGCSNTLARRAESEIDHLKTWEQIYDWFTRYSACDEGTIAEGYSDVVVKMLAHEWDQLPHLRTLVADDSRFRGFVLRHLDATVDRSDLTVVVTNASRRCPRRDLRLCTDILRQATSARSEVDKYIGASTKEGR
jgi:hypothetical protein